MSIAGEEIIEYGEFENDREPEQTVHFPAKQLYQQYLQAGIGLVFCGLVVFLIVSTQFLTSAFDYWTAHW